MHESTVSRVTTNKYVHTPQGIFELKYFFNSSISRFDGEAIASESVKEKIRKIIANEDPRRPLSDQRIAEMLKSSANVEHRAQDRDQVPRGDESSCHRRSGARWDSLLRGHREAHMKIMDILVKRRRRSWTSPRPRNDDVLSEMAGALAKAEPRLDADRLLEVLIEREKLQSTGIGEGVAIPHGKMPGLGRLVASFARSVGRGGLRFHRWPAHPSLLPTRRAPSIRVVST